MDTAKEPSARMATSTGVETAVLTKSSRRCCLCYYLDRDYEEKLGQIAHLDHDRTNSSEDNLAFLCLEHHTVYDSHTSQHKNYTVTEVKEARRALYAEVERGARTAVEWILAV